MHIAFDYGGVLENKPFIMEMARLLASGGGKVSVISAVGNEAEFGPRTKHCESSGIPWFAIRCFIFPGIIQPDGVLEYAIGKAKVEIMRELECQMLFDDNPHICRAVRDAGLQAFQVYR